MEETGRAKYKQIKHQVQLITLKSLQFARMEKNELFFPQYALKFSLSFNKCLYYNLTEPSFSSEDSVFFLFLTVNTNAWNSLLL